MRPCQKPFVAVQDWISRSKPAISLCKRLLVSVSEDDNGAHTPLLVRFTLLFPPRVDLGMRSSRNSRRSELPFLHVIAPDSAPYELNELVPQVTIVSGERYQVSLAINAGGRGDAWMTDTTRKEILARP